MKRAKPEGMAQSWRACSLVAGFCLITIPDRKEERFTFLPFVHEGRES